MWLMLQQDKPQDFVIATGKMHSIREFVEQAFKHIGKTIIWEGKGLNEVGKEESTNVIRVKVNAKYFRPTDVVSILFYYFNNILQNDTSLIIFNFPIKYTETGIQKSLKWLSIFSYHLTIIFNYTSIDVLLYQIITFIKMYNGIFNYWTHLKLMKVIIIIVKRYCPVYYFYKQFFQFTFLLYNSFKWCWLAFLLYNTFELWSQTVIIFK